jgi:hypothetical protein
MEATVSPFSVTTYMPVSVTSPITSASRSHLPRISRTCSSRPRSATTSIRSCVSERRISYGVIPSSRTGTRVISICTPVPPRAAISVEEETSPAAPMSWMPTMWPERISSSDASRSSFSVKGSPTCTWGLWSAASSESSAEAKVAPWMPSRPVRAPTAMMVLPTPEATPRISSSSCMRPIAIAFTSGLPR